MSFPFELPILDKVSGPEDLRKLSDADLDQVAKELRNEVIEVVSQTGGHLGSSLGVVELTVALHAIFKTPLDKLIWDVGHQCYPHKIITGRRKRMMGLRQKDGVSGFTKRSESEYDPFGAAHSSTSISAALGFTMGRELGQTVGDCIAVIGDGSISAGMAYEAMNNAGAENKRLFVILNDNEMSIAPPVGAMSSYLSGLYGNSAFHKLKTLAEEVEVHLPWAMRDGARRARQIVTGMHGQATLFEELGFDYLGPIDGHNMPQLLSVLRAAKARATGPVLIHVCTKKGCGYAPAENSSDKYHGVSKFDIATGLQSKTPANAPSYTSIFGQALTIEAEADPRVVAVTAAMPSGTGVNAMAKVFPKRVFDVGIAEQHGVTFAAGMAASGLKPFCAIYSTFLQRGYDQIVHDVALQNLPVRFAIDRAGLVGADGATHAGSFDLAYLCTLPNFVVMAPSDENELCNCIATSTQINDKPSAFRYPRGNGLGVQLPSIKEILEIGKAKIIKEGKKVALLNFGTRLEECNKASEKLSSKGINCTIIDARFAKPLDEKLIMEVATNHEVLITIEEGSIGGFGSHVMQLLSDRGVFDTGLKFRSMILPDIFIDQDTPDKMYKLANLDCVSIEKKVLDLLNSNIVLKKQN